MPRNRARSENRSGRNHTFVISTRLRAFSAIELVLKMAEERHQYFRQIIESCDSSSEEKFDALMQLAALTGMLREVGRDYESAAGRAKAIRSRPQ